MTTAFDVAYKVWGKLGKIEAFEEFVATGGSTSTVVDGKIADRQDRPEDNYSIDYTALVVRDAGGVSAAPEGEMQRISSFSTHTHTVDTVFTAAPAAGDYIAIANADIPLREMYRAINEALYEIGEIPLTNSSLTTVAAQTEYTLPVALKREDLLRVEYQGRTGDSDDNQWLMVRDFDVIPSTAGATSLLVLPQLVAGRTIRLTYVGVHPAITTYSSVISEYIHPALIIAAVTKRCLAWLNATTEGGSEYWVKHENEASADLEQQLVKHPVWLPKKTAQYSTFAASARTVKDRPPTPFI